LIVEDELHLADYQVSIISGAGLKKLIANEEQRIHRKGYPAY
jgi:hypothetical protein